MIRLFDFALAFLALVMLSPILILVAFILRLTGEGEVFFLQERIGQYNKPFHIIKFATMLKNSPNMGSGTITSKNDPRILPIGKVLRKTKINELPQLLNVLKGEMSLIGPRPHAKRDLQGVGNDVLAVVLNLKPGLSGIGSLVFRDEEKILQMFDDPREFYDYEIAPYKASLEQWFNSNRSIKLYWQLIFLTIFQVIVPGKLKIFRIFHDVPKPPETLNRYLT